MNKPVATPLNVDSSTLVKRTRWHVAADKMALVSSAGATTLAQALANEQGIVPPAETPPLGDPAEALERLKAADPRILLMSLVHLTGDESLLERFGQHIQAQMAGIKGVVVGGIPEELQAEL